MSRYQKIIEELEDFKKDVSRYFTNTRNVFSSAMPELRESIVKRSIKIKQYLKNVNISTTIAGRAPPAAGGFPFSCDLIEDMFRNKGTPYAVPRSLIVDALNKAISTYEALASGDFGEELSKSLAGNLREGFFVDGQYYEAQKFVRDLFKTANKTIDIIDNFIDDSVIDLLTVKPNMVVVNILTKKIHDSVKSSGKAFIKQYGCLNIRISDAFHDRFIIIDQNNFYHLGASIKDLGNRTFMYSLMEERDMIDILKAKWIKEWKVGKRVI